MEKAKIECETESEPNLTDLKRGKSGQPVQLVANCIAVRKWTKNLHHYRVVFSPEVEGESLRRGLLEAHRRRIRVVNTFYGNTLHTLGLLPTEFLDLTSTKKSDNSKIKITLTQVTDLDEKANCLNGFYESICEELHWRFLKTIKKIGHDYFDIEKGEKLEIGNDCSFTILHGYKTKLEQHENKLHFTIQILQKMFQIENVYSLIRTLQKETIENDGTRDDWHREVENELIGAKVITPHNFMEYEITEIYWEENPEICISVSGHSTSLKDYYFNKYGITIDNLKQPILVGSRPDLPIYWKTQINAMDNVIRLIPEICNLTQPVQSMIKISGFKNELEEGLNRTANPKKTAGEAQNLIKLFFSVPNSKELLVKWGLEMDQNLIKVAGRKLQTEQLIFKQILLLEEKPALFPGDKYLEFALKSKMLREQGYIFSSLDTEYRPIRTIKIKDWVCFAPVSMITRIKEFVDTLLSVARNLGINMADPLEIVLIKNLHVQAYLKAINLAIRKHFDVQLAFVVIPENRPGLYSAIARRLCVDLGVPLQCLTSKEFEGNEKIRTRNARKLIMKINCKLGGESWSISIPAKKIMMVGASVLPRKTEKDAGLASLVASVDKSHGIFFSTISGFTSKEEQATNFVDNFRKCITDWKQQNLGTLPEQILFYQDNVHSDDMRISNEDQLEILKTTLAKIYEKEESEEQPKLTFIVVDQQTNIRLFRKSDDSFYNPAPGTIIDSEVTFPGRFDFYLIAHDNPEGTSYPTYFNVIEDNSDLDADKIQRLTYKTCHLYFSRDESETVAIDVPAHCQYARDVVRFAEIVGKNTINSKLSRTLYFL